MIDATAKRLVVWRPEVPPRPELIVRMALNGRLKNLGPHSEPAGRCADAAA
jgi:hypothetical protein